MGCVGEIDQIGSGAIADLAIEASLVGSEICLCGAKPAVAAALGACSVQVRDELPATSPRAGVASKTRQALHAFLQGDAVVFDNGKLKAVRVGLDRIYEQVEGTRLRDLAFPLLESGRFLVLDLRDAEEIHEYGTQALMLTARLAKSRSARVALMNLRARPKERLEVNRVIPHVFSEAGLPDLVAGCLPDKKGSLV
jgi:anti-anti-sigma regulatory factor